MSTDRIILQLVPAQGGGVNDYALALRSSGLAGDIVCIDRPIEVNWRTYDAVLLQYSGYGYARRGAPLWLAHWLRKERKNIRSLGIVFHELYATGWPWSSAFWLSPFQRLVAQQLAVVADFWLTNREASEDWLLTGHGGSRPHRVLATPSNMGELLNPEGQPRSHTMVIFGGPGLREQTYRLHGERLSQWAATQRLVVHDVGAPLSNEIPKRFDRATDFVSHGVLSAAKIAELFTQAAVGVMTYPMPYLAKSGVLGAYAAHGLCPVIFPAPRYGAKTRDGLIAGDNYVGIDGLDSLQAGAMRAVGQRAWTWYQRHSVAAHVKAIQQLTLSGAP